MRTKDRARPARRDALAISAGAFLGVGFLLAGWPFIAQMAPNPGTLPADTIEADLGGIAPGQAISVAWRGKPVLVRRRTLQEIAHARATELSGLRDRLARNASLTAEAPASDANRTIGDGHQWLVVTAVCTRETCRISPVTDETAAPAEAFMCPCCASRYDHAGRVSSGPAPHNLEIPPSRLVTPTRIRIG